MKMIVVEIRRGVLSETITIQYLEVNYKHAES